MDSTDDVTVHVFTDASQEAYAAAAYVRVESNGGPAKVTLAMSKARPAPVKRRSIPMLELQAAVLGSRLGQFVSDALNLPPESVTYWTDSMNVLYWVRSVSRKFKIDVGNRISEIQQHTNSSKWQHVSGRLNPADLPSRGVAASHLQDDDKWWSGPEFLQEPPE